MFPRIRRELKFCESCRKVGCKGDGDWFQFRKEMEVTKVRARKLKCIDKFQVWYIIFIR